MPDLATYTLLLWLISGGFSSPKHRLADHLKVYYPIPIYYRTPDCPSVCRRTDVIQYRVCNVFVYTYYQGRHMGSHTVVCNKDLWNHSPEEVVILMSWPSSTSDNSILPTYILPPRAISVDYKILYFLSKAIV